jgi:hypothetical protein
MEPDPQLLPTRLRAFLAPVPAKELSRRIACDVRTAENIKSGHWPIARHWAGLVAAFGRDLTEAVFHPDAAAERLEQEVRHLEEQLAAKRALASRVEGPRARRAPAGARHEDGTAGVDGRGTGR